MRDVRERPELLLVDADGNDVQRVGIDAHLGDDVLLGVVRHREVTRQLARDLHLHPEESVPTAQGEPAPRGGRVRDLEVAIDRDRMMQRVHERPAVAHEPEQAATETLVVVHEIEVGAPVAQLLVDAAAERVRLREAARGHDPELLDVFPVAELVEPRHAERVVALVEIETGNLFEHDRIVGDRPRLSGEHRHRVPELGELAREVAAVNPLTAAVGIAPVDEESDPKGARQGGIGVRHEVTRMEVGPLRSQARGR